VNLIVPGFDGEDERRGDYDGSAAHLSQLIIKLMKALHVQKAIFCAHSLGSMFCSYFITHHPQYVEGYINVTGMVDYWSTGILVFFQTTFTEHGYNSAEWRAKKLWDDDHHRILIHHNFLKTAEGRSFGPVNFPYLTITEYFAYIKIFNTMPNGFSENYFLNRKH
jgi:pimeloyl-ACP methyl ester carboxylesterase